MSNLATAIKRVAMASSRGNPLPLGDEENIRLAIASAIKYMRNTGYTWNCREIIWTMPKDTAVFSRAPEGTPLGNEPAGTYPRDVLRINWMVDLNSVHRLFIPKPLTADFRVASIIGSPDPYYFAMESERLVLSGPLSADISVAIDCVSDVGTIEPTYDSSSGAWTWRVNGVEINDAYTSPWFTEGSELLVSLAEAVFHDAYLRDPKSSAVAYQRFEMHSAMASAALAMSSGPTGIMPWS